MSRKHNTKHARSKSNYPKRLAARGLTRTPEMLTLDALRRKQGVKAPEMGGK
jgi:hypothetical protein